MKPLIEIRNLSKLYYLSPKKQSQYPSLSEAMALWVEKISGRSVREELWALKDINLDVMQGDCLAVVGLNGSGKSTLLKILSRVIFPTTGEVRIYGRTAAVLEVGTGFHPELTGRENIYLNGVILGMSLREIRHKFDEIVTFAEIENFIDTPVKFYSSGMYVRLAFSIAAYLPAEILFLDEVLSVGDADFRKKSLAKMQDFSKEGKTLIVVSHDVDILEKVCNKAVLFKKGECIDRSLDISKLKEVL